MNDYLKRLVRPTVVAARPAPRPLQEVDGVVPAPSAPLVPAVAAAAVPAPAAPQSARVAPAPVTLEEVTRWVSAPVPPPEAPPEAPPKIAIDPPVQRRASAGPRETLQTATVRTAAPAHPGTEAMQFPQRVSVAPVANPEQRNPSPPAARAAMADRPPLRDKPGDVVEVHVGSIALTVRTPAAAPAAAPATPAPAPAASRHPAAPAREGLRFSASRHHLRWS